MGVEFLRWLDFRVQEVRVRCFHVQGLGSLVWDPDFVLYVVKRMVPGRWHALKSRASFEYPLWHGMVQVS